MHHTIRTHVRNQPLNIILGQASNSKSRRRINCGMGPTVDHRPLAQVAVGRCHRGHAGGRPAMMSFVVPRRWDGAMPSRRAAPTKAMGFGMRRLSPLMSTATVANSACPVNGSEARDLL
jgi:hypothetical protein